MVDINQQENIPIEEINKDLNRVNDPYLDLSKSMSKPREKIVEVNLPRKQQSVVQPNPPVKREEVIPEPQPPLKYPNLPTGYTTPPNEPKKHNIFQTAIIIFGLLFLILVIGFFVISFSQKDFAPTVTNNVDTPDTNVNITAPMENQYNQTFNLNLGDSVIDGIATKVANEVIDKLNLSS